MLPTTHYRNSVGWGLGQYLGTEGRQQPSWSLFHSVRALQGSGYAALLSAQVHLTLPSDPALGPPLLLVS